MNRTIRHQETLVDFDGPQLFLARDEVGMQYICLLVEEQASCDKYLCVLISSERLWDFFHREIDLRNIYEQPEGGELFCAEVKAGFEEVFQLVPLPLKKLPKAWLPELGFLLEKQDEDVK